MLLLQSAVIGGGVSKCARHMCTTYLPTSEAMFRCTSRVPSCFDSNIVHENAVRSNMVQRQSSIDRPLQTVASTLRNQQVEVETQTGMKALQ